MASGYHQQEIAPGGCSHAIFLNLHYHSPAPSTSQQAYQHRGALRTQLITARDDVLTVYDVYERSQTSTSIVASTSNGVSQVSSSSTNASSSHKLVVVRKHNLFGAVTGLQCVQTLASDKDGRDRLLVSFKDAKLALLEWNDATDDLETVSIHTYERAPQLLNGLPNLFHPILNVDPLSRCAALRLPHDALAVLPFYRDAADFDFDFDDDLDLKLAKDDAAAVAAAAEMDTLPYSPSFVLTMREVDPKIRNLKDFTFLPGFQKPTVAVLFSHTPTWTGLLAEHRDTFSVYLFTLDLSASLDGATFSSAADALDDGTVRSAHPVVTTSSSLPFDCLYMVSCPQTLGGVIVVCMSSLLHVDQSGRVVVTALNSWFKTISSIEPESTLELDEIPDLQSSQLVFTSETGGVLGLVNGNLYRFRCQMDGRSVEGFRLERMDQSSSASDELVPATGPPASFLAVTAHQRTDTTTNYLFSASMAGDSTLYSLVPVSKALKQQDDAEAYPAEAAVSSANDMDLDLDLDDDLYGTSDAIGSGNAQPSTANKLQTILTVRKQDEVHSHGALHSIARRKLTADEPGSSKRYGLVGASGSGNQAGLVYFDPRFVPEMRTELVAPTTAEGEPEPVTNLTKVFVVGNDSAGGVRMIGTDSQADSSIIFSTPAQLGSTSDKQDQASWTDVKQLSTGTTLYAGELVGGEGIARITSSTLQVLSSDTLDILDETVPVEPDQGSVLYASLDAQQYAVVHTSDGATLVYRYDAAQRRFESMDVSAALGAVSPILSANVFRDTYGDLERARRWSSADATKTMAAATAAVAASAPRTLSSLANDDEEVDYGEDDDEPAVETKATNGVPASTVEKAPAYLFALDADGVARIWSLPDLQLVWQNASLAAQPQRLRFEQRGHAELAPEQKAVLTTAVAYHLGDSLCIVSLTSDHFLTVYRSNAWASTEEVEKAKSQLQEADEAAALGLMFNKVLVQVLSAPAAARSFDADVDTAGYRSGAVKLVPFTVASRAEQVGEECNALAVLGGGREAQASVLCWTEQGGCRLLDWPEGDLSSLSSLPSNDAFAYCDRQGRLWLARVPPGLYGETSWMASVVRTGREYTKVVAHDPTHTVVAASVQPCRFVLFDEDGEPIRSNEADEAVESRLPTVSHRGALELFIGEDRTACDGYEFEANETVTALEIVTLDAPSTTSGRKDFIAAGTTTFHGEDRTAKGSVYLFEVIEVVSSPAYIGRDLRLKLVCRDDSRAPVTAISQLNGFLVSTCGQKLFVRALEKEEWLISIAFLDCPFYITSIRIVKNFVLLSDAQRSLMFLAFQEEPYRFVELGRDLRDQCAMLGEYLVYGERLGLVSAGEDGVMRVYEYVPAAAGGTRLVLRTEFQTSSVATDAVGCRGRWLSDSELRGREEGRNRLLFSKANGALESLAAVDEKVAKRLHLLQGQLVRSVLHTAALNPRAYRAVRNDFVSRAQSKGILDGRLLDTFTAMSRPKMLEAVKTLSGLFDGLDVVKEGALKRKHKEDGAEEAEGEEEEEEEELDFAKQERLRLQSEHKRVQLVLKDLLRLRLGFEQV